MELVHRNRCIKAFSATLIAALAGVLGGCTGDLTVLTFETGDVDYSETDQAFDSEVRNYSGFYPVTENGEAALYINGTTTEIAVKDKRTGVMWYSNPPERSKDTLATTPGDKINAALAFETMQRGSSDDFNPSGTNITSVYLNSCADAVLKGQYSFKKIEDGIRVNYGVGTKVSTYLCPQILSIERYEELTKKMSEDDRYFFSSNYCYFSLNDIKDDATKRSLYETKIPILKKRDVYLISSLAFIDSGAPPENNYAKKKIHGILESIGYTQDDLDRDNAENLVVVPKPRNIYFEISVEYKLDGPDLIAVLPRDSLKYDTSVFYLKDVAVLPFFGAAGTDKKGYMVVPDGSGALINLNNGKLIFPPYEKKVYGDDVTSFLSKNLDDTQIYLPIYGMKQDDNAFLAIIEKGDGSSAIHADISGRTSNYNTIYAAFTLQTSGQNFTSILGQGGLVYFQERSLQSDIQIRYIFLSGNEADYTGMALRYQRYLLDNRLMIQRAFDDEISLYVDLIGAITYNASFLGIPYESRLSLTGYSEAVKILEEMKSQGIGSVDFQYSYWCNGGQENTVADKAELIRQLGSFDDFKKLVQYTAKNGVDFYPQVEFGYTEDSAFFRLFKKRTQASRYLDNTVLKVNISSQSIPKSDTGIVVISPLYYDRMIDSFLDDYKKLGTKGLALSSFGTDLNGDYRKGNNADREAAKKIVIEQVQKFRDNGYGLSIKGANAYLLKYAEIINNIPTTSGENYLFDGSIPFYQIVLHGIVPYSGEPANMSSDYDTYVLKLIESGAVPSFRWMYKDNYILKDTKANFYGINYRPWLSQAASLYEAINDALKDCRTSRIVDHETIQNGFVRTAYENGTNVYVNYNDYPVTAEGITVEPKSYSVTKGERAK